MTNGADGQIERTPEAPASVDMLLSAELRSWLQTRRGSRRRLADVEDVDLRRGVRRICSEAHERGVPVERMIVAVKRYWRSLRDDPDWKPGRFGNDGEQLDQLISMMIEEFYRE